MNTHRLPAPFMEQRIRMNSQGGKRMSQNPINVSKWDKVGHSNYESQIEVGMGDSSPRNFQFTSGITCDEMSSMISQPHNNQLQRIKNKER